MNNTATNTATCPTVRKQIGKTTYIVPVSYTHLDVYKRQDYFLMWICVGLPFGIRRMCLWLVPSGYGISVSYTHLDVYKRQL